MFCKTYASGWSVSFERLFPSGLYLVEVRDARGDLHDKVRCDDYWAARERLAAFKALAKAG